MSEDTLIDNMTPEERFQRTPRPLRYARVRLDVPSGQASYISEILEDERSEIAADIEVLRNKGQPHDSPEIVQNMVYLDHIRHVLNEIHFGILDLGPNAGNGTGPRPYDFVKVRLNRGGQVDYILSLMQAEQDALFEDLRDLRIDGKPESDDEVQTCRRNLPHVINFIRGINRGRIELVGPDD